MGHFESGNVSSHNLEHLDAIRHPVPNYKKRGAWGITVRMVQNIVDSGTKPISKMRWSGGLEFRENRKERENRRGRVGGGDCRKT